MRGGVGERGWVGWCVWGEGHSVQIPFVLGLISAIFGLI